jgi:three-Cys-motif partner protein
MDDIMHNIPPHSKEQSVLTFCFVDPPDFGIHFKSLERLATSQIGDFLILLADGMDIKRNVPNYLKPDNKKIDLALDSSSWRHEWDAAGRGSKSFSMFIIEKFKSKFAAMGYKDGGQKLISLQNNVGLYRLVYFSKHPLGIKFSKISAESSSDQLPLFADK